MGKNENKPKSDESMEDLQAELIRLQRQFRLLEDDRRAYKEETEYVLKKQRDSINNLNGEHEELMKETKLAGCLKNKNFDSANIEKLQVLLEEEENVKEEFKIQCSNICYVNNMIKGMKQTTTTFRKNMGGCKESERRYKAMIKLNRVMENRLNEANVKFNTALAENTKMRKEIDHINTQRRRFAELQKKLSKMLTIGKEEKDYLIEKSTLLFNSRDEAQHRMHSLRERSERDMNSFSSELKDLLRVIDHDRKLREFMRTKMEERSEIYEAAVNGRKEKKLMDHIKGLQIEVEHYESIFNELIQVSGISDIDEMVYTFISVEDENFSIFNFVKEQTQEIQQKEGSIEAFKQQIDKMQKDDVRVEQQQKEIMEQLKISERNQIEQRQKLITQLKTDEKMLNKICVKIDGMLDRVRCNRSSMMELLGGSKITNVTLLSYLGLIEQRSTELSQAKTLIQMRKGEVMFPFEEESNPLKFSTVGKLARYLIALPALPTLASDLPDCGTPANMELVRPISQREARELATNLNNNEHLQRILSRSTVNCSVKLQ